MSRRKILTTILAIVILVLIGVVYVYDIFIENVQSYPYSPIDFRDEGSYSIDPDNIFSYLENGDANVFMPETPIASPLMREWSVRWSQVDYLNIANSLSVFVWGEALNGWKLYSADFLTTCRDNPKGFELGELIYFKTIIREDVKLRETGRGYLISPRYGNVKWGGNTNFPYPFPYGWKRVELENITITADDVLRIAEENGGEEVRMSVNNQCRIDISLSGYTNWEVSIYSYETGNSVFRMQIDPFTGEIK